MTGRRPLPMEERKHREHGTNVRYRFGEVGDDRRNGCRCTDCTTAAVLYEKRAANRKRRGIEPYVPADEARRHLEFLRANGVGLRTVAEVSGVVRPSLRLIARGERRSVRPSTAAAILGVHLGHAKPGAVVDGRRTAQHLEELFQMGHSRQDVADRLGMTLHGLLVCTRGTVRRATADLVAALHEELTRERDARRQFDAERKADYRTRRDEGRLNYTRAAS